MTSEERENLQADLAMLRAQGVQEYVAEGNVVRVVFFPAAPAPAPERETTPRPARTDDERLFDPLGIGKKR